MGYGLRVMGQAGRPAGQDFPAAAPEELGGGGREVGREEGVGGGGAAVGGDGGGVGEGEDSADEDERKALVRRAPIAISLACPAHGGGAAAGQRRGAWPANG